MISAEQASATSTSRRAALLLLLASGTILGVLAHHPVAGGHAGKPDLLHALAKLGGAAATVHAVLIVLLAALLYGVLTLALELGMRHPAVAFGLTAYTLGYAAMTGAMLLDGFVTASVAQRLLGLPAVQGDGILLLISVAIQVLTKAGLWGLGVGMACLSWAQPRATRLLAVLALPAALLPAAASAFLPMAPHSLIALSALQALWYAGASFHLWRGIDAGQPGKGFKR